MKTKAINKSNFIWVLTVDYLKDSHSIVRSRYFTSKAKAVFFALNNDTFTSSYKLDGKFKVLSDTLIVALVKHFEGGFASIAITREILR